jgi:hypothetical protein
VDDVDVGRPPWFTRRTAIRAPVPPGRNRVCSDRSRYWQEVVVTLLATLEGLRPAFE